MDSLNTMPCNIEAEQSVLGSILLDPEALGEMIGLLKAEDFYDKRHQNMYSAMAQMYMEGKNIDPVTLVDYLKGDVGQIGGLSYAAELFKIYVPVNIMDHVNILKECSYRRQVAKIGSRLYSAALEGDEDPREILMSSIDAICQLEGGKNGSSMTSIGKCMHQALEFIEGNYKRGGGITGMETGYGELDDAIDGLNRGEFIVVAGRSSMGKTAFALNMASKVAVENRVAIFSLEMPISQISLRLLSPASKVKLENMRKGKLSDEDFVSIVDAAAKLSKRNLIIDDSPGISIGEIKARCRKLKMKEGLDLVVEDYIGLIESGKRFENRQQEISSISRQLKAMAKELDIALVALSQLNRAPEARSGNRPQLGDLRESGAIEQDADIVLLLYREDYYKKDTPEKGIIHCIIAKNRNGPTGDKKLNWLSEYQLMRNNMEVLRG